MSIRPGSGGLRTAQACFDSAERKNDSYRRSFIAASGWADDDDPSTRGVLENIITVRIGRILGRAAGWSTLTIAAFGLSMATPAFAQSGTVDPNEAIDAD